MYAEQAGRAVSQGGGSPPQGGPRTRTGALAALDAGSGAGWRGPQRRPEVLQNDRLLKSSLCERRNFFLKALEREGWAGC